MAAAGLSLSRRRRPRWLDRLLVNTILLAGLVGVILAVQLLVLLALGRFPTGEERTVLVVSMIAAGVAALLYQPARQAARSRPQAACCPPSARRRARCCGRSGAA